MKKTTNKKTNIIRERGRRARIAAANQLIARCQYHIKTAGALTGTDINDLCDYIKRGICSNHRDKMRDMLSLSTPASCNKYCKMRAENGATICAKCYALSMLKQYKDMEVKNQINAAILNNIELPAAAVPFINACIFRFESFGDLNSTLQFKNYCTIAANNPRTTFAIWTKNAFIIRDAFDEYGIEKPKNMIIIYSSPFVDTPAASVLEKYNWIDKVFTVYSLDHMLNAGMTLKQIDSFINCGAAYCAGCQKCYSKNKITFINEMLKQDQQRFKNMREKAGIK